MTLAERLPGLLGVGLEDGLGSRSRCDRTL